MCPFPLKRVSYLNALVVGVFCILVLPACSLFDPGLSKKQQVAKNWSETIRASQVLPVYPLTEDLQPGDVFARSLPISRQQEIYEEQGFLPLNQRVTRLDNLSHGDLYRDAYWTSPYDELPHARPTPLETSTSENNWKNNHIRAPRASFPTYTFEVNQNGGLNLAIPVQGIPLSLGIMGAKKAKGSISIEQAYTYGVSGEEAYRSLRNDWWQSSPQVRQTLLNMARSTEDDLYLRVVTRVYFARRLNVSLRRTESMSGNVRAGTDAMSSETSSDSELIQTIEGMNEVGGSANFKTVRNSTISFERTFDRPVNIGFRGFDVKVLQNGQLSAPIPSYTVLTEDLDKNRMFSASAGYTNREDTYESLRRKIKNHQHADEIRKRVLHQISPYWKTLYEEDPTHTRFKWLLAGYMNSGPDRPRRMDKLIQLIKQQFTEHGGTEQ